MNNEDSFIVGCFAGNLLIITTNTLAILPNATRAVLFHYRVKLNKGLSELYKISEKERKLEKSKQSLNNSSFFGDVSLTNIENNEVESSARTVKTANSSSIFFTGKIKNCKSKIH